MSNDIGALQELPGLESADLWELDEAGRCVWTCGPLTCDNTNIS
jgi:hypothetical protein